MMIETIQVDPGNFLILWIWRLDRLTSISPFKIESHIIMQIPGK